MQDFEKFEADLKQVAIDGESARRIDQDELHADKTANATSPDRKAALGVSAVQILYSTALESLGAHSGRR
ncbi:hypothetical protein J2TS6_48040 [Paenibacillus albilobatus]|uniref:Uncharacterized protein n=2 Tax=Paenibacillus TaxID=44249 RepID=A0A919XP21_9BACL|nr:hypothetical protein J2TS6_48040 [Paenibacillus albilobatus]